ncbi:Uncharacterised protein [Yersinia frederiksenii]|nr:Uncharacterised protein [Yersinia frederiksenii]
MSGAFIKVESDYYIAYQSLCDDHLHVHRLVVGGDSKPRVKSSIRARLLLILSDAL